MDLDRIKKRFGLVAVEKGFAMPEQIVEAMTIQIKENLKNKQHRLIGAILIDSGYMKASEVEEVLAAIR